LSWPQPAVDQHEVGPGLAFAARILLERALEAAAEDLAHHRVVVASAPSAAPCRDRRAFAGIGGAPAVRRGRARHRRPRRRRAGRTAADVETAIGALDEALRPRDDHRALRRGALDVAVVVDLDAPRAFVEAEHARDALEQLGLCAVSASRRPSASRALVSACSTGLRLSPRSGTHSRTLCPAFCDKAFGEQVGLGDVLAQSSSGGAGRLRRTGR
jgi:hypothetical protein